MHPTRNGRETYHTSGPERAGCICRSSWICIPATSSAGLLSGHCVPQCPVGSGQPPYETGPCNQGTEHRHCVPVTSYGLHPPYGPWQPRRIQAVVATVAFILHFKISSKASAGVFHPSVFRGRLFSVNATASNWSGQCWLRSVPFGKYWRNRPFVFSLLPRGQGF